VFVHGELWKAVLAFAPEETDPQDGEPTVGAGSKVTVVGFGEGGTVQVVPAQGPTTTGLWTRRIRTRGGSLMHANLGLLQAVGVGIGFIALVVIAVFVVSVVLSAIKIVKEYERGVIFRLGRVQGGPKGPGSSSCCRSWTRWSRWT
jgi:hypothetical protein